ncbi:hypothetical protein G7K_6369-t1 [Saitoella complicata NRRL Y-17804]|uniref:Tc1-like transposase DDE domain-containing protein n=1 Tax=Saitoella complicata (strain BCRC 22490 / CBS 7301 / JCM 7358 / NBRC 10748 / NRRL Y-17804) TaxID=698492 RepID=A0A0E9NR04_SAICN|nr:hypothetical protein G7K_6369-t1 [Saitoella complicata NRRL Y-17804]
MLGKICADVDRDKVINQYASAKDVYEIATDIERSPRTGNSTCGRKSAVDEFLGSQIKYLYDKNPTLYQDDCAEFLNDQFATSLSRYHVTRYLQKIGYTRKVLTLRAAQRNPILRANHAIEMADYTQEQLVFLDESAVDERTGSRKFGYSPIGARAIQERVFGHSTRWSVLPALTIEGLKALRIFQGSFNADRFVEFIEEDLLPIVGPFPGPNSVIVLDNCRIHHDPRVAELLVNQHGCRIVFLPPYSPDLNPIELCFSMMKAWMKRNNNDPDARLDPASFIRKAIDYINTDLEKIRNLYTGCGYALTGMDLRQYVDNNREMAARAAERV